MEDREFTSKHIEMQNSGIQRDSKSIDKALRAQLSRNGTTPDQPPEQTQKMESEPDSRAGTGTGTILKKQNSEDSRLGEPIDDNNSLTKSTDPMPRQFIENLSIGNF